jgi:hypothetical protein
VVGAGITTLRLLQDQGGIQGAWSPHPGGPPRLPALRHLDLEAQPFAPAWDGVAAAHMRGAARLVAAHAPALRTLRLRLRLNARLELPQELLAAERAFLESVLLAGPLPALERLDLRLVCWPQDAAEEGEARALEALRPLSRLSLPRLARLGLDIRYFHRGASSAQVLRWLEGAHLPALRRLSLRALAAPEHLEQRMRALEAPRWAALEALDLIVGL